MLKPAVFTIVVLSVVLSGCSQDNSSQSIVLPDDSLPSQHFDPVEAYETPTGLDHVFERPLYVLQAPEPVQVRLVDIGEYEIDDPVVNRPAPQTQDCWPDADNDGYFDPWRQYPIMGVVAGYVPPEGYVCVPSGSTGSLDACEDSEDLTCALRLSLHVALEDQEAFAPFNVSFLGMSANSMGTALYTLIAHLDDRPLAKSISHEWGCNPISDYSVGLFLTDRRTGEIETEEKLYQAMTIIVNAELLSLEYGTLPADMLTVMDLPSDQQVWHFRLPIADGFCADPTEVGFCDRDSTVPNTEPGHFNGYYCVDDIEPVAGRHTRSNLGGRGRYYQVCYPPNDWAVRPDQVSPGCTNEQPICAAYDVQTRGDISMHEYGCHAASR